MPFFGYLPAAVDSAPGLAETILCVVIATVLLVGEVSLVWTGRRRLLTWIDHWSLEWTREIGSHRLRSVGVRQIRSNLRILVRLLSQGFILSGLFLLVAFVLELFDGTKNWGDHLLRGVTGELKFIGGSVVIALSWTQVRELLLAAAADLLKPTPSACLRLLCAGASPSSPC